MKRIMHKNLTKNQEMISGFEGPNAYPTYDDKNFFSQNVNDRRHLFMEKSAINKGTGTKFINSLMWEANLREYGKNK